MATPSRGRITGPAAKNLPGQDQPTLARINATSPELMRAYTKLNE